MKSFKKLYATMKESIDFVDLFSHNSAQRALERQSERTPRALGHSRHKGNQVLETLGQSTDTQAVMCSGTRGTRGFLFSRLTWF